MMNSNRSVKSSKFTRKPPDLLPDRNIIIGIFIFLGIIICLLVIGISIQYKSLNTSVRASGLVASVALLDTDVTGKLTNPASVTYTQQTLTTPQDTGYYLNLSQNGIPVPSYYIQYSSLLSNGTWTAWSDFYSKNDNKPLIPVNGIIKVDYALWPPLPLKSYTAKYRVKGQTIESNPVTTIVTKIDMTKYFLFKPGNYWSFKGCLSPLSWNYASCDSSQVYWVRMDVQAPTAFPISYSGKTYNITSNPIRITQSLNVPSSWAGSYNGQKQDYTLFHSADFDPYGTFVSDADKVKWNLKTTFYQQTPTHDVQSKVLHNVIILSTRPDWPAYIHATKMLDLTRIFDGISWNAADIPGIYGSVTGDIAGKITSFTQNAGWRAAFKVVSIQTPFYTGKAIRARYKEWAGTQNLLDATSVNFDEWFFAKGVGLVAVNNKDIRGIKCSTDNDCADRTTVMATPQFSVAMDNFQAWQPNSTLSLKVGNNGIFGTSVSIHPCNSYQIQVIPATYTRPYSGFLEVLATFTYPNGSTVNFSRQILVNANKKGIWFEKGIATIPVPAGSSLGTFKIQVRPLIQTGTTTPGANSMPWSNTAYVVYQ